MLTSYPFTIAIRMAATPYSIDCLYCFMSSYHKGRCFYLQSLYKNDKFCPEEKVFGAKRSCEDMDGT